MKRNRKYPHILRKFKKENDVSRYPLATVFLLGAFMNMNYLLAGTVSTNPILFMGALFLILAWKTAGWWGLDRWVLPALGTPWRPGYIFKSEPREPRSRTSPDAGLD